MFAGGGLNIRWSQTLYSKSEIRAIKMAQNGAIVPKGGREGFSNLFGYIIILVSIDTIVSVDGCLDNQLIVTGSKDRCIGVWSLN